MGGKRKLLGLGRGTRVKPSNSCKMELSQRKQKNKKTRRKQGSLDRCRVFKRRERKAERARGPGRPQHPDGVTVSKKHEL